MKLFEKLLFFKKNIKLSGNELEARESFWNGSVKFIQERWSILISKIIYFELLNFFIPFIQKWFHSNKQVVDKNFVKILSSATIKNIK